VDDAGALPAIKPDDEPTADTTTRDLAFLLSTSGAESGPRAVAHTHAAAFAARAQAEYWLDAGESDIVWCTADTGSALAVWNVLLGPWSRGAEVVLHEGAFDPEERLDLIRRLEVTVLCQTPAEYRALAETGSQTLRRYRPESLRRMVSTSDFLSSDVVAAFQEAWELTIWDGYGPVECGIVAGQCLGMTFEPGSIGQPLPGFDLAVVDESGSELPAGAEGQLALRGRPPSLFAGYWDAPEDTKAVFRGDLYVTGDVAIRDTTGSLRLLGRGPDVITSGRQRFSPFVVEERLVSHPAVEDAGVVGIRDLQRGGQYVRAFVVLNPKIEGSDRLVAEIRQHLRKRLPEEMVPREVEFVAFLPRTQSGKVRREELRERVVVPEAVLIARPAPQLMAEPEPIEPRRAEPEEDETLLPDFVVPRSQTYAAPIPVAEPEAVDEEPPEEEELPDYIVPHEDPLPEHVVEFLQSEPLQDIEHVADVALPKGPVVLPKFDVKQSEPKVEEPTEPALVLPPRAEAALERIVFAPEPEPEPEPELEPGEEPGEESEPQSMRAEAAPELEPEVEPEALPELVPWPTPEPEEAPELQLVPDPEPEPQPEPDPALDPEPEPELLVEPEPEIEPEPEQLVDPEPELVEPELVEPELELLVDAEPDLEPAPELLVEPELQVAPEPEPVLLVEHEPELIAPLPEPELPAALPEPEADPDAMPDYVIVPPSAPEPPAPAKPAAKPAASRPEEQDGQPKRRRGRTRRAAKAREKRMRLQKSAPEPGEESQDLAWMQNLSSRLDAYSFAADDAPPLGFASGEPQLDAAELDDSERDESERDESETE
jgi:hypothetical protein